MPGVNQQERELLTAAVIADYERRYGVVPDLRELLAASQCDGCGFIVRRFMDPTGPLPSWERSPDGLLLCPNCQ